MTHRQLRSSSFRPHSTMHRQATTHSAVEQQQAIEEHYAAPANLERLLAANLKVLTENGRVVKVEAYRLDDSACHGRFGVTARTAPINVCPQVANYMRDPSKMIKGIGNNDFILSPVQVPNLTATQEIFLHFVSSGANSIGYLVLFVTASAFLLDLLCGSTEQLTLEI
nr:telomere repeat-binding factor 1-like [Ipomoea trifida]GLL34140.1 telomere repeat-binding factor 1-like [Ipomoea trifida]